MQAIVLALTGAWKKLSLCWLQLKITGLDQNFLFLLLDKYATWKQPKNVLTQAASLYFQGVLSKYRIPSGLRECGVLSGVPSMPQVFSSILCIQSLSVKLPGTYRSISLHGRCEVVLFVTGVAANIIKVPFIAAMVPVFSGKANVFTLKFFIWICTQQKASLTQWMVVHTIALIVFPGPPLHALQSVLLSLKGKRCQ